MKPVEITPSLGAPRRTRGRKEQFVSMVPYSSEQKLNLMLETIRTVVAGSALMQEHLLKLIDPSHGDVGVQFVPGDRGEIHHDFDWSALAEPLKAARRLDESVKRAREDLNSQP